MLKVRGGAEIDRNLKILLLTAVPTVVLDQIAKALIIHSLARNQVVRVIPGLFNIVHFRNTGAAFGIFTDGGALKIIFLVAVSLAALAVMAVLLYQSRDSLASFAFSLIAGGAVGNLIDRLRFGSVVDFLDVYIGAYHWPAFNVADSAITVGVLLAVFSVYFRRH